MKRSKLPEWVSIFLLYDYKLYADSVRWTRLNSKIQNNVKDEIDEYLLFGAVFDDGEVSVSDLLADLVLDSQLRGFSDYRFTVTRIYRRHTSSLYW